MEVSVDEMYFDRHSGVGRSCCLLTVRDGAFLLLSYPVSLFCEQYLYHPMQRSRKTLMEDFSFFPLGIYCLSRLTELLSFNFTGS